MRLINLKKHSVVCLLAFALTVSIAFSQGGSNYSIFGFGDFNSAISSSYEGTAGTSIAIPNDNTINFTNPALISLIKSTRLQVGYRFNQNMISDANSSIWQNNGGINAISINFAFDTSRRISASFGLVPLTKVNYLISKKFEIEENGETIKGSSLYRGAGGLSAFYGAFSSKLFAGLHFGAALYGNFGSIKYNSAVAYEDTYSYTNFFRQIDYFSGIGYKAGIYWELPHNLSFGAYYQNFGKLNLEREKSYSSELLEDSTFNSTLEVNAPSALGFGISYSSGKFMFGADFKTLDVSKVNYGYSVNNKFTNSAEYSFGLVRKGNYRINAPILDRSEYRFGISYSKLYYEIFNSQINDMKLTLGMGVPFASTGNIDAALIFGNRGTTSSGLVSEYYGKLVVDISIGEGWFHPFKREY